MRQNLSPVKRVIIFLDCIEELKARPLILKGLHDFHFRIDFEKVTGKLICKFSEADQEQFRSFLMTLRKFISNNEPANIDGILKTCCKFVKGEQTELKEVLKQFKAIWGYLYRKGTIQITSGPLDLSPTFVLDLWLNGQYFHSDPQKTERLKELLKSDLPAVKLQLLWSLPILTETIIKLGALISKALNENAFDFPDET